MKAQSDCTHCGGKRTLQEPAQTLYFMGRPLEVKERSIYCPSCSVAYIEAERCSCIKPYPARKVTLKVAVRIAPHATGEMPVFEIVEGGVTGYESFYVDEHMLRDVQVWDRWTACAGTPGRWDKLEIHQSEMLKAMRRMQLLPPVSTPAVADSSP